MPRRSQEAYCNRAVCPLLIMMMSVHWLRGHVAVLWEQAYCNRAVCPSVCHSVCNKLFSSLTENQALKQATQAELVIYSDLNWRSLVLKLRSQVMAWFAYPDCRGWRSGLYWRQNCPHLTAWRLVGSICTTDSTAGPEKLRQKAMVKSTATSLACWYIILQSRPADHG